MEKNEIRLLTTSYPIFSGTKLVVGLLGGQVAVTKGLNIIWDVNKTVVTAARLVINASSDQWLPTGVNMFFNGEQVLSNGNVTGVTLSKSLDIISLLQNGVNTTTVIAFTDLHGATVTIYVSLEVDFQGKSPSVEDTFLGVPLSVWLIGGGAVITAIIGGMALGRRAKKG